MCGDVITLLYAQAMERTVRPPYTNPLDWVFRNRQTGRVTVAQWPNAPLLLFLVAAALRAVVHPGGIAGEILSAVAAVALITWAVIELVRGVNPFRRLLGGVVLAGQLVALVPR